MKDSVNAARQRGNHVSRPFGGAPTRERVFRKVRNVQTQHRGSAHKQGAGEAVEEGLDLREGRGGGGGRVGAQEDAKGGDLGHIGRVGLEEVGQEGGVGSRGGRRVRVAVTSTRAVLRSPREG